MEFFQQGSTSSRLHNLSRQCHQLGTKCLKTWACVRHFFKSLQYFFTNKFSREHFFFFVFCCNPCSYSVLFWFFFYRICICVSTCRFVYLCAKLEEGIRSLGTGIRGSCVLGPLPQVHVHPELLSEEWTCSSCLVGLLWVVLCLAPSCHAHLWSWEFTVLIMFGSFLLFSCMLTLLVDLLLHTLYIVLLLGVALP